VHPCQNLALGDRRSMLFEVLTNLVTSMELDCDDECVLLAASRSL
jgi:hypothetical protein